MYYQQGVFNCDYFILDLLKTQILKLNQAVISGMVTVYTVVCF
uniref:Uncharacterized protein n=1 Tax=Sphenodon punctatus TaxID=8508 RepID=A0A8D0G5J4_SPHPU